MDKIILFFILISYSLTTFSQENKRDTADACPTVYLIGVFHSRHFDKKYNYSIIDLKNQIVALKPDLVCGEITPDAINKPMEGYYPPEVALLAELASILNYRFEPVDWRLDYATQSRAASEYPQSVKQEGAELIKKLNDDIEQYKGESIYDYFHDKETLHALDSLYENIICKNALSEIAAGSWNERNRCIIENGMAAAGQAQTIVFVFGIDHLPQLQRYLKKIGIEALIPKRMFIPDNNYKVPEEVLERWKRNLENLISIRDKKVPATYDNYNKVVNSNRIQDIQKAIEASN